MTDQDVRYVGEQPGAQRRTKNRPTKNTADNDHVDVTAHPPTYGEVQSTDKKKAKKMKKAAAAAAAGGEQEDERHIVRQLDSLLTSSCIDCISWMLSWVFFGFSALWQVLAPFSIISCRSIRC